MAPLTRTRCRGAQLKLLACHISGGEQSGTVYANGQPIVEAEFKNQLAVVWQSDVLLPTATVRRSGIRAGFRAWGARLHAGPCCHVAGRRVIHAHQGNSHAQQRPPACMLGRAG